MSDSDLKIGLFYGSTTCYTEMAAEKIQQQMGEELIELHNIKESALKNAEDYEILIFGISTWDFGELQEDWESKWDDIKSLNLEGKIVALYGMGDQEGYTDWFQDALGMLHDELQVLGCHIIGYWPNTGYEFAASKALTQDGSQFVGLALDDETQFDKTDERIQTWVEQLFSELESL